MKKIILTGITAIALLASCGDSGKEVEAKDAQKVEDNKTTASLTFVTVDAVSKVKWRAAHLGGVEPRFGSISVKSAEAVVNEGALANATVVMDMNSFTVENFEDEESKMKLTGHLKNGDFFLVDSFPTATFVMTNIEAMQGDFNSTVTGNLTIKAATKSITFNANVNIGENDITVKSEDFAVDRKEWNLSYHVEGSEGVPADYIIQDEVGFTIDVKLTK